MDSWSIHSIWLDKNFDFSLAMKKAIVTHIVRDSRFSFTFHLEKAYKNEKDTESS